MLLFADIVQLETNALCIKVVVYFRRASTSNSRSSIFYMLLFL